MIESVELSNFLSHKNNIIKFDEGITALIGHNGAGKSSIMDAVMFSLFGDTGRDATIDQLQRTGENQTYTKTTFKIKGTKYHALRTIVNGTSKRIELQDESGELIAKGDGAVKEKIKELIGLDHSALKIASIVPANELQSIVEKGDVFRDLVDKVLGAEKFKKLDKLMTKGKKEFETHLKEKFQENSYTDVKRLEGEIKEAEVAVSHSIPKREELEKEKEKIKRNIKDLDKEIADDIQKEKQLEMVETKKDEFISYVKKEIEKEREKENSDKKRRDACQGKISIASQKNTLEDKVKNLKLQMDENREELGKLNNKKSVLENALELTDELENGTCPVCNSEVDQLEPKYQKEHIESEINSLEEKIVELDKKSTQLNDNNEKTTNELDKAKEATIVLAANSIENESQLQKLVESIKIKINKNQEIEIAINSGQLLEASLIDMTAEKMFSNIMQVEKDSEGFNHNEFQLKKENLAENRHRLEEVIRNSGQIANKITSAEKRIEELNPIIKEMKLASDFISEIDKIKNEVFSDKSKTFVGLRYYALRQISETASSYLEILGTSVRRVKLEESNQKITTLCDTISGIRPLGGFSTGEQRCVALAIRLAMSELMTRTPLKTIMLDEPTANLDPLRCDMFLEALRKLSNSLNQNFQFIIATNQEELWTNANVGTLYKLENPKTNDTIVKKLSRQ
jgi:exonuclease SbcC